MTRFITVRTGHAILSVGLLSLFVFFIVRMTGDPTNLLLPDLASDEVRDALREKLGLNLPIYAQFAIFIRDVFRGDLGTSFVYHLPVAALIAQRAPATILLAVTSLALTIVVGLPLGVMAAYWRGGWVDRMARWFAAFGQAAPAFWVGLLLIVALAVRLHVLPPGGMNAGAQSLVLPTVVIALAPIAGLVRLLRSSMLEVLDADFVKVHRLKGMSEWRILWKHALRNAALSTLTYVGVLTAGLLSGSVIVESVFAWPGLGWLTAQAIKGGDFAVIQGVLLVVAVVYIATNLLVDLLYGYLNPRLR